MPTFEVTIASPDGAAPEAGDGASAALRVLVEAPHWIDAWREGLRVLGEGAPPTDAECEVGADQSVRVWIPGAGRAWFVRPRAQSETFERAQLAGEGGALVMSAPAGAGAGTAFRVLPAGVASPAARRPLQRTPQLPQRTAPSAIAAVSGPPPADAPGSSPADAPGSPRVVSAPGSPPAATPGPPPVAAAAPLPRAPLPAAPGTDASGDAEEDPLARHLSTGDRARLGVRGRSGFRVSVPSAAPEEPPTTARRRREPESTRIGRAPSNPPSGPPEPREAAGPTADYHAVASNLTLLPQQFRAITVPPPGTPTPVAAAQEAVENAWQHIPCQLAQALRWRTDGDLEVVAARGERERETLLCRVSADANFDRWLTLGPARVKFAEDRTRIRYLSSRGELVLEVPVRSALCVPVRVEGERWGVVLLVNSTRGAGFAEGEMRAISYLGTTLSRALDA